MVFSQLYLLASDSVGFCDEYLNHYLKDRPNNISTSYDRKMNHILLMLDLVVEGYKKKKMFEPCKQELAIFCWDNLTESLKKIFNLSDRKFVFQFIDDCHHWFDQVFFGQNKKRKGMTFSEKKYISPFLLKIYYIYVRIKRK